MKNEMTKEVALKILVRHNEWRRGAEIPMLKPEIIGMAMDKAIEVLRLSIVAGQSEQLGCDCGNKLTDKELYFGQCLQCDKNIEEAN